MPEISLSFTITAIIALCALISPIATTLLNNRHQLKIKELELKQKHYEVTEVYKRNIFENYLKYAGSCTAYADTGPLQSYGEYYFLALMYVPDDMKAEMVSIHADMVKYHWDQANTALELLTPKIYRLLQTM